jgi:hypothetical protein
VLSAVRRFGEVSVAVPGHCLFEGTFAAQLLADCRRWGIAVRTTPSISPIGSVFARSQFCLGGDYGYQGIQSYAVRRLLTEPSLYSPRLPLVVYGGPSAGWKKLGVLLSGRLPREHEVHAYPNECAPVRVLSSDLWRALRSGGTALVPPSLKRTYAPGARSSGK